MNPKITAAIKRKITIPEYYNRFIDPLVNLRDNPKQCCPFHQEDTPSFSYSPDRGVWRCFGACKAGGDVIEMHRVNYKMETREEAAESLAGILEINESAFVSFEQTKESVDPNQIEVTAILRKLELQARTPEDYVKIDEAMSYFESSLDRLVRLRSLLC